ncbi:hypothetical protein LJ737_24960 [Hymenobacter sp. 15J16-1T3B]|uniref:hypothetical protein n=1 Tax=Hymenobacter sp. 15J16-1T3B TaxID=2886941 RepID=UPI001D0FA305|nr:hypothetical protein [Hymenobacter sp. 15J16-1T3B]MCC3160511.1 hypothetical protein [Hymenobacter sp. 15J16-1T3B]
MLVALLLNETSPVEFGLWLLGLLAFWLYAGLWWWLLQRKSRAQRMLGCLLAGVLALLGLFCYEDLTWWSAALVVAPLCLGLGSGRFRPIEFPNKQPPLPPAAPER